NSIFIKQAIQTSFPPSLPNHHTNPNEPVKSAKQYFGSLSATETAILSVVVRWGHPPFRLWKFVQRRVGFFQSLQYQGRWKNTAVAQQADDILHSESAVIGNRR